ncbi:unnamed protein product [Withania somnifera]
MPQPEDVTLDAPLVATNNNSGPEGIYRFSGGYKVAIARAGNNPHSKSAGAGMTASIWDPYVEGQQHSACRLKIQKGADVLQVGWRVDPTLYGDIKPRLFIHFETFEGLSHRGDEASWEDTMSIGQDLVNGNWWFYMGHDDIPIGFWPKSMFTSLASLAAIVEWGGVVYSPPGVPEPPMGASYPLVGDTSFDAYCETIDVDTTITHVDSPDLYQVKALPLYRRGKSQHFVLYGGPGEKEKA